MTDAELVAALQADPAQAARVLPQVRVAVLRGRVAHVATSLGRALVLGAVYEPLGGGWGWYLTWRADLDHPRGVAESEGLARAGLIAALEERGWAVVLDERVTA